jgi:lysophospholipase L1-like esterase
MTGSGWRGGFAFFLAAGAALSVPAATAQDDGALLAPIPDRRADHEDREGRIAQRLQYARQRWAQEQRLPDRRGASPGAAVPLSSAPALPERDGAEALRRFHQALAAYERFGRRQRLVILHIGDSHTAGDHWSGYLRERFQRTYGDGGRGQLAAGVPSRYYDPYQVRVAQTDGWDVVGRNSGQAGIVSYGLRGDRRGERIEMQMRGTRTFDMIEVEFERQTGGGDIIVAPGGRKGWAVSTRGRAGELERARFPVGASAQHAILALEGNGPVHLLSWSFYKSTGGIAYVSHGVGGETVGMMGKWSSRVAEWQMKGLNPALIVVAFGTNEGFEIRFKAAEYEAEFRERLSQLRRWAPNASIAVVTAPDVARLPSWCGRGAVREQTACRPLSAEHAANYPELIDRRSTALCYWHTPPGVTQTREIQRKVARELGLFYWDWSKVMRGECGTDRWARESPQLALTDRVHMRLEGYDVSGEALFQALMQGYRR